MLVQASCESVGRLWRSWSVRWTAWSPGSIKLLSARVRVSHWQALVFVYEFCFPGLVLSNSRLSSSRRRRGYSCPLVSAPYLFIESVTGIDEQAFNELAEQYEVSQQALAHQEAQFQEERVAMQAEIDRLKSELEEAKVTSASETERADHLERD